MKVDPRGQGKATSDPQGVKIFQLIMTWGIRLHTKHEHAILASLETANKASALSTTSRGNAVRDANGRAQHMVPVGWWSPMLPVGLGRATLVEPSAESRERRLSAC